MTSQFTVYILRTSSNTLYVGQTNNLERRLKEHSTKGSKSAKYIRSFTSSELVYIETYNSRGEAMRREAQIKRFSKKKKEELVLSSAVSSPQADSFKKDL